MSYYKKHILLCTNQKAEGKVCCANTGGKDFFSYLKTKLVALNMHGPGQYRVSQSGCLGRCALGPCIVIYPEGIWYSYHSLADIDRIINEHLIAGQPVEDLLLEH